MTLMKRILALLMVIGMLLCFTGCDILDYNQAMELYKAGEFAQARDAFRALGDYADSPDMAWLASQKADYEMAEIYFSTGDYALALPLYQGLDMYMDSPVKAIVCQYHIGIGCIEAGAYEEALTYLEPLENYEDCPQQVLRAKWLWLYTTVQTKGDSIAVKAADGTICLTANEDGTLTLSYLKKASLLGMPYESSLTMVLQQGVREAQYTALYVSSSTSKIQEEATGTLDIAQFHATAVLPVDSFSQVNVDPDGVETSSSDPADALMMRSVFAETQAALSEGLPTLLESSEVPISTVEFGFAALQ